MTERVFLSKADVTSLEADAVREATLSGWVAPLGPEVDAFEAEIAERTGTTHALALASGTAALHLALLHLGARAGAAVLVPSMTFGATANAVAYTGAEPVFVDCLDDDANVDPALLVHAIDTLRGEGREVSAALTVDLFGAMCDYSEIVGALADRGVPLVEDAAEALGSHQTEGPAGSFGVAAALSFNGNKIMTTSGGGMLVSNDADVIARARHLSTQAREPVPWYEHRDIGYNYRMSNVLAALGRAQLSRLDGMIARRREIRARYREAFADLPLRLLGRDIDDVENCWLSCIILDDTVDLTPDDVVRHMDSANIEARHLWKPMHQQPVFESNRSFLTGSADRLFSRGVALPSGSILTDDDVDRVILGLRELVLAAAA